MIKRNLIYISVAISIFILSYFTHDFILDTNKLTLSYSLIGVYLFNIIASCIIYFLIDLLAKHLPNQAGYGFLAAVFIKIGLLIIIYGDLIFSDMGLAKFQRISLVVPFFLFLIIETVFSAKLLNLK